MKRIELLDCTLRDGAYIVNAEFGENAIKGIIANLQNAHVDVIECGWLKDTPHKPGTSFFHLPDDLKQYMTGPKNKYSTYVMMIDYNRYDCSQLPECDGETIDAIRVVFPKDKVAEGVALVDVIRNKGYKVYLQAANTLGYSDAELLQLVDAVNAVKPEGLSIVDTFGAMYPNDLMRIMTLVNNNLDKDIKLGFHSHNNQQLSYALSMQFINDMMRMSNRTIVIDSSLCGMGRGAGNTNTELITQYINNFYEGNYDLNVIMDTIDVYMTKFMEENSWGYSIPYSIAGMYGCHVNNVAYLLDTHRTRSKDMRIIFESLSKDMRIQYDYDNLEKTYTDYMNKEVNDSETLAKLREKFAGKTILTVLPGASSINEIDTVKAVIDKEDVVVVGINSVLAGYNYDCLFFSNATKYEYSKENYSDVFNNTLKITASNVKVDGSDNELIVNYNDLQKREWKYYDNSMIVFLRLMAAVQPAKVLVAGFDGYLEHNNYAPGALEPNLSTEEYDVLQKEIMEMLSDCTKSNPNIKLEFVTKSPFEAAVR